MSNIDLMRHYHNHGKFEFRKIYFNNDQDNQEINKILSTNNIIPTNNNTPTNIDIRSNKYLNFLNIMLYKRYQKNHEIIFPLYQLKEQLL